MCLLNTKLNFLINRLLMEIASCPITPSNGEHVHVGPITSSHGDVEWLHVNHEEVESMFTFVRSPPIIHITEPSNCCSQLAS